MAECLSLQLNMAHPHQLCLSLSGAMGPQRVPASAQKALLKVTVSAYRDVAMVWGQADILCVCAFIE